MFSRAVGREEHCKQISLVCAGSARGILATLGLPLLLACVLSRLHCSGSRLLCQELSETDPGLYALHRSKPLRFRYSGSPQRHRLGWACVLCPSQVRAAQVMRCLASVVTATHRLPVPAARFSGCITGAPSQAAVDCPQSQEVLVSNEACLQFGR